MDMAKHRLLLTENLCMPFLLTSETQGPLGTLQTGPAAWQSRTTITAESISTSDRGERATQPKEGRAFGQAAGLQPKEKTSSASLLGEKPTYTSSKTNFWLPLFSLVRNSSAALSARDHVPW